VGLTLMHAHSLTGSGTEGEARSEQRWSRMGSHALTGEASGGSTRAVERRSVHTVGAYEVIGTHHCLLEMFQRTD